MRLTEITCPGCGGRHGKFLAEEAAFEGQPTIAPKEYPLGARYADYNRRFFGGELPMVPLGYARMKGVAGRVTYKVQSQQAANPLMARIKGRHYNATLIPNTLKLELSADFRRPEAAFDSILLHEMIHVEMAATGRVSENHGPEFLGRARAISAAAGIPVPAVCPSDWFAVPVSQTARPLGVLLLRKTGGAHSFALIPPDAAAQSAEIVQSRFGGNLRGFGLERVTLWTVTDPAWSALAMSVPIQRSVGPKTKFFILKDETPLADLERDGKMILDLTA